MRVNRKFYCGAREILTNDWARRTEKEAIEHAKDILYSDPGRDSVVITKIIRVVRRAPRPVVVEKVE